jgi:hypothetical protein
MPPLRTLLNIAGVTRVVTTSLFLAKEAAAARARLTARLKIMLLHSPSLM